MKTIWKYPFELGAFAIDMPNDAKVLTAAMQNGQSCMWVEVDPNAPLTTRKFTIVGTGHPIPIRAKRYVCTFQNPPFVWHLYET